MSSSSQERDHSIMEHEIALPNVSVGGCKIRWGDAACAQEEDRVIIGNFVMEKQRVLPYVRF
jgi:hypothetical protein